MRTHQHAAPRGGGRRSGRTALALLFFLFGASLFGLPFLRAGDATEWNDYTGEEDDWTVLDPARNPETDTPFIVDAKNFDREFEGEVEGSLVELIAAEVEARYGMRSDALRESGIIETRRLPAGRTAYEAECAGCHGREGDGGGPAARHLQPRPRNFWKGMFKFTSTESGGRPTHQDLYRTITRGLAGASMPGFALLSEERLWDIIEYVRWLALRGEFQQLMLDVAWDEEELPDADEMAEIVEGRWRPENQVQVYPAGPETPRDQASIDRGRELFADAARATCFQCHGYEGRGDGPTADDYLDDWGYPIRPRDFTAGVFRAGSEPKDLYLSIATGIGGSPMGAFGGVLDSDEIWDLVHYTQSLAESK